MTETSGCDDHDLAAPTGAHEKLKPFEGTFRAALKLWMGSGEPTTLTGTMTSTFDLGSRFLHQRYVGDPSERPFSNFEGRGYWGFNKATNKYEGFWIDTASTVMQTDSGDVDESGTVWTMTGSMPGRQRGTTMTKRTIITLKDNDHHSIEMYFEGPDGGEVKGMEIQYTRV